MNTKKKYLIIAVILCLNIGNINAQKEGNVKFEFGVNGFHGISGLSGAVNNGKISPGVNYQASAEGKYYLGTHFGLGVGVGYATYTSEANLNDYISNTTTMDDEGESFEYRVSATNINEELELTAIEIPIFMTFQNFAKHKIGFQSNAGLKASFPIEATYQCSGGSIETKGYYPSNNVEFANMENHGFETIDYLMYNGNLYTSIAYSAFGTIGITIPMSKIELHLGLYGSYGFTPILNPKSNFLIDYPGNYNSLCSLSKKVTPVCGGLTIGISFLGGMTKPIKATKSRTNHGGRN